MLIYLVLVLIRLACSARWAIVYDILFGAINYSKFFGIYLLVT